MYSVLTIIVVNVGSVNVESVMSYYCPDAKYFLEQIKIFQMCLSTITIHEVSFKLSGCDHLPKKHAKSTCLEQRGSQALLPVQ